MMRQALTIALLTLAITGCDRAEEKSQAYASPAAPPMVADAMVAGGMEPRDNSQKQESGESYTYDHNLTVSMASDFIRLRFERARDACQMNVALKCRVTQASFRVLGEPDAPLPIATLTVALPHDSVKIFEDSLMIALSGEDTGDIMVKSRQTSAQNVTAQVRDIQARLNQLANYRDRMADLAKRRNASTDDLIKIEAEISRTQGEIEQIESQKRELAERIARENLTISFEALSTASDALQPVRDVWQSSLHLLAENAAAALGFVVGTIPWIPVLLLGFFLLRFIWRRTRKNAA